jgi:hypothetical protein
VCASGAMGALREHAFVDELKNGRLPELVHPPVLITG